MVAPALLTDLQRQGFHLEATGDRLRVIPASRLTDELRHFIRQHKTELLREAALTESCREHGLHADAIKQELQAAGDWDDPSMTAEAVRCYVRCVAQERATWTACRWPTSCAPRVSRGR